MTLISLEMEVLKTVKLGRDKQEKGTVVGGQIWLIKRNINLFHMKNLLNILGKE